MMARPIPWHGELPECDLCGMELKVQRPALYDGKTKLGPWANMCEEHLITDGYPFSQGLTNKRIPIPTDTRRL
jgi:hypothetical protein